MGIREIEARSILRKRKAIDSWFVSRCGMNLYRGCGHDCVYCDGRSEPLSFPSHLAGAAPARPADSPPIPLRLVG